MRALVLLGRAAVALVFLRAVPAHFQEQTIAAVSEQGMPLAGVFVPLAGLLALAGGISVLLGWRAKVGGWLLVAYLVPVTLLLHPFWLVSDPAAAAIEEATFFRNLAIVGAALLISWFGAGPLSMDGRPRKRIPPRSSLARAA